MIFISNFPALVWRPCTGHLKYQNSVEKFDLLLQVLKLGRFALFHFEHYKLTEKKWNSNIIYFAFCVLFNAFIEGSVYNQCWIHCLKFKHLSSPSSAEFSITPVVTTLKTHLCCEVNIWSNFIGVHNFHPLTSKQTPIQQEKKHGPHVEKPPLFGDLATIQQRWREFWLKIFLPTFLHVKCVRLSRVCLYIFLLKHITLQRTIKVDSVNYKVFFRPPQTCPLRHYDGVCFGRGRGNIKNLKSRKRTPKKFRSQTEKAQDSTLIYAHFPKMVALCTELVSLEKPQHGSMKMKTSKRKKSILKCKLAKNINTQTYQITAWN